MLQPREIQDVIESRAAHMGLWVLVTVHLKQAPSVPDWYLNRLGILPLLVWDALAKYLDKFQNPRLCVCRASRALFTREVSDVMSKVRCSRRVWIVFKIPF